MKLISLGKIRRQYGTPPKFLISISWLNYQTKAFWKFGQLYRGYAGLYFIFGKLHFNLWIHHVEA